MTRAVTWPNGRPEIGQRAARSRRVTARDIERFTEISGDRNPLHYDEAAALGIARERSTLAQAVHQPLGRATHN